MDGEVVHLLLFDVGAEVDLGRVTTILGQRAEPAPLVAQSPVPPYAGFPRPLEIRRPASPEWPDGSTLEVRVHPVGVIGVRLRAPFAGAALRDLQRGGVPAADEGRARRELEALFAEVRADVAVALKEPYPVDMAPEPYRVICITGDAPTASRLLVDHRQAVAMLVAGETGEGLVPERVESAFRHVLRYREDDVVVLGWDDALLVDPSGSYEDVIDVIELANLELLEFRTYDAYLDRKLDESFRALDRLWAPGGLFRSARATLEEISKLRVEFARLTDNLHDTGKVFGDWYLAQVHQRLHERFHVSSWERAVSSKMRTLEDLFHLAEEEANHRRSIVLELMIVALFVLDLIVLFALGT